MNVLMFRRTINSTVSTYIQLETISSNSPSDGINKLIMPCCIGREREMRQLISVSPSLLLPDEVVCQCSHGDRPSDNDHDGGEHDAGVQDHR